VVDTYLMQLMIGYFLTSISDDKTRRQCVLQLDKDCQGVGEEHTHHSGLVIMFAALFYAFFVFDIYGDTAGWKKASVLSIVVICIPWIVWLAIRSESVQRVIWNIIGKGVVIQKRGRKGGGRRRRRCGQ
jgi:hypothetical protein